MDEHLDELVALAVRLRTEGTREACGRAADLSDQHPRSAAIAYQAAWAHDTLGLESGAVRFYERALTEPGLAADDRHGCFVGLGSTYRALGRYGLSLATLRRGLAEFPDDPTLRTFLAMALYNTGDPREAVRTLLKVTAATSADPELRGYRSAIEYYADHLDQVQ
jgi:tetratricopeptide (TPR) repeat protein